MANSKGFLGVGDIVLMNVVAILSIRQIPNVAPYGALESVGHVPSCLYAVVYSFSL